ncbi:MAG: ubiquinone/menaquinone biosynthesis methyltransferase [Chlorobi bacterium]|nr:ubiquinone/menaquinone biosynthesis methyltransferase [Chlorobiota bacterium]
MKYSKDKKFIGRMFDEISPTYDRLNHLLSGFQDKKWRRSAVKFLGSLNCEYNYILDLAAGSGDLGLEFLKLNPQKIYSVDLSVEMLKLNQNKLPKDVNITLQADAEDLPFENNFFDLCGIAFGVRNFESLERCIRQIHRVLKPEAKFLTIEMFKPQKNSITNKSFKLYFEKVLPKIGNAISKSDYAYDYLSESVDSFLTVEEYSALLEQNGFKIIKIRNNFLGFVHSVFAEKI